MTLAVGDPAPDFELVGVDGVNGEQLTWKLSHYRGQPVVLVFYPADNSPVCSAQLAAYTRGAGEFEHLDAIVLALSPQSPDSHRGFARAHGGFGFPLLSDEDRDVARAYGNLGLLDLYRRCTYVIDSEGRVAWLHRYIGPGLAYRPVGELVNAVVAAR